jgi:hypothetical protein
MGTQVLIGAIWYLLENDSDYHSQLRIKLRMVLNGP